jgi:hypothetical protein
MSNHYENSNNTNVCIYAYYEKDEQYRENLSFFLRNGGILDNVDYYIVINGECTLEIPNLTNIKVIYRPNHGFDFGAWQNVIKNYIQKKYEYYIFINSSVRGPYIENGVWLNEFIKLFETGPDVKMVGTTIHIYENNSLIPFLGKGPYNHVQSMFFILNNDSYQYLSDVGFFDDEESLNQETCVWNIVIQKELKIGQILLKHGWNINCLLPKYRDLDYRTLAYNINTSSDPCFPNSYFGKTIQPHDVIFYKLYRFL